MSVLKKPKLKEGKKTIQLEQITPKTKPLAEEVQEATEEPETTNPYVVKTPSKPKTDKCLQ